MPFAQHRQRGGGKGGRNGCHPCGGCDRGCDRGCGCPGLPPAFEVASRIQGGQAAVQAVGQGDEGKAVFGEAPYRPAFGGVHQYDLLVAGQDYGRPPTAGREGEGPHLSLHPLLCGSGGCFPIAPPNGVPGFSTRIPARIPARIPTAGQGSFAVELPPPAPDHGSGGGCESDPGHRFLAGKRDFPPQVFPGQGLAGLEGRDGDFPQLQRLAAGDGQEFRGGGKSQPGGIPDGCLDAPQAFHAGPVDENDVLEFPLPS